MKSKENLLQIAQELAKTASDKKGLDIKIMDMEGISFLADYFVLVTANNVKQSQAIADEISDKGAQLGLIEKRTEGYRNGEWILVDLGDVVCHIFSGEYREFYGLEELWNDATIIPFEGE